MIYKVVVKQSFEGKRQDTTAHVNGLPDVATLVGRLAEHDNGTREVFSITVTPVHIVAMG